MAAPVAGGAPEGDAQAALKSWTEQQGVVTGRGPPIEQDWTKRETELAYLVVDD